MEGKLTVNRLAFIRTIPYFLIPVTFAVFAVFAVFVVFAGIFSYIEGLRRWMLTGKLTFSNIGHVILNETKDLATQLQDRFFLAGRCAVAVLGMTNIRAQAPTALTFAKIAKNAKNASILMGIGCLRRPMKVSSFPAI